jgi:hypothetical protein
MKGTQGVPAEQCQGIGPFVTECEDSRWRLEMGALARIIGSRGESLFLAFRPAQAGKYK